MSRMQAIDAILTVITILGPVEDTSDIYRRMKKHCEQFDIDEDEFGHLWDSMKASGLVELGATDASAPSWSITASAMERMIGTSDKKDEEPEEDPDRSDPDPKTRVAAELRWLGGMLDKRLQAIEHGLDHVADSLAGIADSIRGRVTCAEADALDEECDGPPVGIVLNREETDRMIAARTDAEEQKRIFADAEKRIAEAKERKDDTR